VEMEWLVVVRAWSLKLTENRAFDRAQLSSY